MTLNKTHLLITLLILLGALYAANVFNIGKISALLIEKPIKLSFTVIAPNADQCEKCFDSQNIISLIDASHNIKITGNKTLVAGDFSYDRFIEKYGIKNLPAIVIAGDISDERILGSWVSLAGEKKEGKIVIQNLLPYYDLTVGEVKGVVDVIVLVDETCAECFDENQYMEIMNRLRMTVGESTIYDVSSSEGSALVLNYNIKKIPALVLSSGARYYPKFTESWKEVGTEEEDGIFILRQVQKLGGVFKEI